VRIALAVSGHGYGHSVRSAEVAKALLRRGVHVIVRTDAPRWLYPHDVEWVENSGWPLDVGVVQRDGLELDIDATRHRWCEFTANWARRVDVEAQLLCDAHVDVVLGDIPPLAFAAAAHAGIPSYGLTNFTWDWIYAAWPNFEHIVAAIRDAYSQADGLFRLPLHGDCGAFRCIEDVPLIARKAARQRDEVRRELCIPSDATTVLLSFGGFTANGVDFAALGDLRDYVFVVAPPLRVDHPSANVVVVREQPRDYVSLLAACDVVVTKPGYGIVADCLANRVRVLFTDRGPFREYDMLAEGLRHLARARYVPRDELLRAELGPHLVALMQCDSPWTDQAMNGADIVAERLVDRVTIS
jgi:UDP:flavonoid glycosyltransferase YjiC (YdhE family)